MPLLSQILLRKLGCGRAGAMRRRTAILGAGLVALLAAGQPVAAETIPGVFSVDMQGPATKEDEPWIDGAIKHGFRSKVGQVEYYAFYYDVPATHGGDSPKLLLEGAVRDLHRNLYRGITLVGMNSVANVGDAADDFTMVDTEDGTQGHLRVIAVHGRVFFLSVFVPVSSDQPDIWKNFFSSFKIL